MIVKIYVLGICGTFMGGLAQLAMQKGIEVAGCDENIYPPMSNILAEQSIKVDQGFNTDNITDDIDLYVIGNVVSRGNPLMEEILNKKLSFVSGPHFLTEIILENRHDGVSIHNVPKNSIENMKKRFNIKLD